MGFRLGCRRSAVTTTTRSSLTLPSPWNAITLDTPGTLRALAFFLIVLGIAIVALRIAVTERGRYRILAAVAALCGVTAGIVWIHELVGATKTFARQS